MGTVQMENHVRPFGPSPIVIWTRHRPRLPGENLVSFPSMKPLLSLLLLPLLAGISSADLAQAEKFYKSGDFPAAFHEYSKLAEQGDPVAENNLGRMYYNGEGTASNIEKAHEWIQKAVDQGNVDAMVSLGEYYAVWPEGPRDNSKAMPWFRKAADAGNREGQFDLGVLSINAGAFGEAVEPLRSAAKKGHAQAAELLGGLYENGRVGPRDPAIAASWYQMAADNGSATAAYDLGVLYAKGDGVPQSVEKATQWWQKAADQGLSSAQTMIATRYMGQKKYREAVSWLERAARQADSGAELMLAEIYGGMVPQSEIKTDLVKAHMMANLAAVGQMPLATTVRQMLARKMTAEQVQRAQKMAAEFKPKLENPVVMTPEYAHKIQESR
jgi:TPR repeat protein